MREKFREWDYQKSLRIKYKDETGQENFWSIDQSELLSEILGIVNRYMRQRIKLTNRQLYYQLVASNIIPNAVEVYKRVCKFLTDGRYGGYIDWSAIEDRGRVPTKPAEWENLSSLIESAVYSYRLPRWTGQKYYLELYCEKQAMESILKPIANKYHIYFGYNKGYSSASNIYELAKRVGGKVESGKEVIILYLGDHDPSGLDMVRDMQKRIEEFLTEGQTYIDPNFEVVQLALNMEQVEKYKPSPNPAKITDPRARGYIAKYGNVSWELDSLKPEVLMSLTEKGILDYLDLEFYQKVIRKEQREIKKLREFGKTIKG